MARNPAAPLRLLAHDATDLEMLSAAVQDAVVKVGDIRFESEAKRLTVALNRYRWEGGGRTRVRSGLQFGSVRSVQGRKIRRDDPEAVLELLAITFEEAEAPGGAITFSFAGGGDLRATVECVEGVLADISAPWPTPRKPRHEA